MTKFSIDREMRRARASEREGAFDEAKRIYNSILTKFPNNARARTALSELESPSARPAGPGTAEMRATSDAQAHIRDGRALREQGRLHEAIACLRKAQEIAPASFEGLLELGIALKLDEMTGEAIACFQRASKIEPASLDAHMFAGLLLKEATRYAEAVESFREALRIDPNSFEACYGLGISLMHEGRSEEALECYRRCLKINPDSAEVCTSLGFLYKDQEKFAEASEWYRRALRIKPDSVEALTSLGSMLVAMGKLDVALAAYERALEIEPGIPGSLFERLRIQSEMCDWRGFEEFERISGALGISDYTASPFVALAFEDCPERQAARARSHARQMFMKEPFKREPLPLRARPGPAAGPIRIGYFSADFREHPTPRLITGVFRAHDRSRFEIFAYSFGPPGISKLRDRVARAVDQFIDVTEMADADVVSLARGHELDIAIDLMGYTKHARSNLFASRLAPVQISFLGYPGTMGTDFMDYIVADPVVIPEAERQFYTEKIICLPHSYQPNDDQRETDQTQTTRADFGLPETGFVFCCFNQTYKIGPREFDIWMRVLQKVENGVLWLLPTNEWAMANLRREAQRRGVDPGRLVFARKLENPQHLARHRHADLFVDTFNYNAHTTASDALWTGLPVVTMAGRQFAARVGASLLTAIGLPELITENKEDYEALIMELATNPGRLAAIKAKLVENRLTQPLFDTVRYTRDFEAALEEVHARQMQAIA